jgi:hypothetical protein
MATTYEQFSREDFEEWLVRDLKFSPSEWRLKPGRGGVYQLYLSPTVAIEINSTTGHQDEVLGHGKASMSLWLASRINGRVLNRKAMEQSHFKRTKNWRETWKKGVSNMQSAYLGAKDFYDRIASIEDLEVYKADTSKMIESVPNWTSNDFLADMHAKVKQGSVLSDNQMAAIKKFLVKPKQEEPERVNVLRMLWSAAKREGDQWTMEFTQSIANQLKAGRPLTPRQEATLDQKLQEYSMPYRRASLRALLAPKKWVE